MRVCFLQILTIIEWNITFNNNNNKWKNETVANKELSIC